MKKEFKITKDNYKGYLELFLLAYDERTKKLSNLIKILGISFGTAICLSLFSNSIAVLTAICSTIYFVRNTKKLIQKYEFSDDIKNNIKELYPYVDTNIKYDYLYKKLLQNKIIKYEEYEIVTYEEEYLNYIECEEIKEELINERLYETTITKPTISEKELEQAKLKVKKLIYPAPYRGR